MHSLVDVSSAVFFKSVEVEYFEKLLHSGTVLSVTVELVDLNWVHTPGYVGSSPP